jgi:arginyl-tRNA synthetase
MTTTPLDDLRTAVVAAAGELRDGGAASDRLSLERPKKAGFGDYSTNAAMLLAPVLGEPPRAVAERLGDALQERLGGGVEKVEVAGPGFLNLFLADAWYLAAVDAVLAAGDDFGRGSEGKRVQVEFVSANPTGPLTAASGRHAAFGDALARILELSGNEVQREYYFNDGGGQVQRLGESILARARGEQPPEDGYQGEYVTALAEEIPDAAQQAPGALAREGIDRLMAGIRATLERYRVHFDRWFLERSLYEGEPSPWDRAREKLIADGLAYEHDGALWLRTTALAGDEKDRPLVRSTGEPTYLAADVAYHWDKLERGFDVLVNVLGSDHHGYVVRLKAIIAAAGADPERLVVPLIQFVHVVEGGARASMSKRRGDFVTLDELIEEIGVDATRFFMLSRSNDSTVDLDITLAKSTEKENPVYYVQYAHARTSRILERAGEERVAAALAAPRGDVSLEPAERELIKKLLGFPAVVSEASARRAPHLVAVYALELAQQLAAYYRDCPVLKAESDALMSFRLATCVATRSVLARSLGLLGVSAPDAM